MKKTHRLTHEFVETIPDRLDEGSVYICIPFATVLHNCACGCGHEVVTPLRPTDWKLTYDGQSVSLSPSVGNWSFPCRSHYIIRRNRVQWAARWSKSQVAEGRRRDRVMKESWYRSRKFRQAYQKSGRLGRQSTGHNWLRRVLRR